MRCSPERSKEWETGFDLGFFNGMSDMSFSYYNSKTYDVIFQVPLPPSSGYQSQVQNGATISNKGYEVQWNFNSKPQANMQWSLGLLWAQNRNNVDAIHNASIVFLPNSIVNAVAIVGSPVGSIYGYDFYRCGKGETVANVDIDNTPTSGGGCGTGYAKNAMYIGADGFPIINTDSNIPLGSAQPNWTGAIRGSLTPIKNLQFSFLFDIRNGSQAYNGTRGALYVYGTHKDTDVRGQNLIFGTSIDPGAVAGPGAGQAVLIDANWFQGDGGSFGNNTASFVEDAGFTKLREIALAYTWDGRWVTHNLGLSSLQLRVAGRNLYTWTKYTGIDPEFNLEGVALVQGVDWFSNPQARSFVMSITLNR